MSKQKKQVLILGGGFGGIKTALNLCGSDAYDITLMSDSHDFKYYPALYRSATGGSRKVSIIPLADIFEGKPVTILHEKAVKLDRDNQIIVTESKKKVAYDILVVALGSITNYFGIEGLQEFSYGIKSIEEAEELKQHLHDQMLNDKKPDLNYVVVGGGPTGIELAGALPHYLRWIMKHHGLKERKINIELVEAAPRLLPRMPIDLSMAVARQLRRQGIKLYLGQTVKAQTADELIVNDKPIKSHTVVWTAGMASNQFLAANGFALERGRIQVDEFLRAKGEPAENIYVIGDNAITEYSGMAQTALHDAVFLAENLKRLGDGGVPKVYRPKKPIYVFPAGERWAAVLWGSVRIYGWLGWALREAADWVGYHDVEPWWKASELFLAEAESEEACPICGKSKSDPDTEATA
ncbi:MAG TPA: FAD-dependent oxidoreductase [Candidatus Saccharimonadales bacterium]|nr:FAD-dependent oxidoreductase [Candidatus Saccharimonadales bacterium]